MIIIVVIFTNAVAIIWYFSLIRMEFCSISVEVDSWRNKMTIITYLLEGYMDIVQYLGYK